MIYHMLAYLLILHHWNHIHNTNQKDFSMGCNGVQDQGGKYLGMQLKSHRNQWSKDESTRTRTYKTYIINHSIQQLLQFNFKALKPCKTPVLKKISINRNTFFFFHSFFFQQGTILQQLPPCIHHLVNIPLLGTLGCFYDHGEFLAISSSTS